MCTSNPIKLARTSLSELGSVLSESLDIFQVSQFDRLKQAKLGSLDPQD